MPAGARGPANCQTKRSRPLATELTIGVAEEEASQMPTKAKKNTALDQEQTVARTNHQPRSAWQAAAATLLLRACSQPKQQCSARFAGGDIAEAAAVVTPLLRSN